jgi:DNA polymerase-3 subunit epsilon
MNLDEMDALVNELIALVPIDRPVLFFDTETTGPNPREDRIVELGFIQVKPDRTKKRWQTFMNPGMPIPREASHGRGTEYPGHGITDAMVQGCRACHDAGHSGVTRDIHDSHPDRSHPFLPWPAFGDLAANLRIGFSDTDFGGYNVKGFDLPLIQSEFGRNGIQWSYADASILDGFRLWQVGQTRTLSDASEIFLRRKHVGAHRALDDVETSIGVIVAQLKIFTSLPRTVKAIHEKCWPKNPDAIDPDGQIVWKNGEATMNFGKNWRNKPLKMMQQKDLRWIVSAACQGANSVTKQICADALVGAFPTPLKETV